jgi:protein TonB
MNRFFILLISLSGCYFSSHAQDTTDVPFMYVEQMPTFPGGEKMLYKFISDSISYPEEALKKGVEGYVTVQFIVRKDGSIENARIMRGIGYGCDEEALRVINSMNIAHKWNPGMHKGRAMSVTYTIPIKFVLQKPKASKS